MKFSKDSATEKAKTDLAKRLKISESEIEIASVSDTDFQTLCQICLRFFSRAVLAKLHTFYLFDIAVILLFFIKLVNEFMLAKKFSTGGKLFLIPINKTPPTV